MKYQVWVQAHDSATLDLVAAIRVFQDDDRLIAERFVEQMGGSPAEALTARTLRAFYPDAIVSTQVLPHCDLVTISDFAAGKAQILEQMTAGRAAGPRQW